MIFLAFCIIKGKEILDPQVIEGKCVYNAAFHVHFT